MFPFFFVFLRFFVFLCLSSRGQGKQQIVNPLRVLFLVCRGPKLGPPFRYAPFYPRRAFYGPILM